MSEVVTAACECPRCGRSHHRLAALPPIANDAAIKAIVALREPAACFAAVANTIRQSTADIIEHERHKADRYALALMMIREGCEDPRGFARVVLSLAQDDELRKAATAAYWLMKSAFDPPSDVPKRADHIIPALGKALGLTNV